MPYIKQVLITVMFILLVASCGIENPTYIIKPIESLNTICYQDTIDTLDTSFKNYTVSIERTHSTTQGTIQSIDIKMYNPIDSSLQIGSFNLLLIYDASIMSFQSVDPGQFLTDCNWDYFTYRWTYSPCYPTCLTGEIRISAIADINPNPSLPTCFAPGDNVSNQIAKLNFLVTNDRYKECSYGPIRFYWQGCDDNELTDVSGNLSYLNNQIFNYKDTIRIIDSIDLADDVPFPTFFGANSTCNSSNNYRIIDFINGGIDIACADSIDARGDLDLNEKRFEQADIDLYLNYFLYGTDVFTVNTQGQIYASDVNHDSLTLTLADFVSLTRLHNNYYQFESIDIVNKPYQVNINLRDAYHNIISIQDSTRIAAANIIVEGDYTPELIPECMTMIRHFDSTKTHILIYSLDGYSFSGDIVTLENHKLISLELSDYQGNQLFPVF